MSTDPTLVIRGGLVADGFGGEPYEADVAVRGDRIVAVGKISARGDTEIDARGLLVTPGFVDVHTHYDAQVTWSGHLDPSSWNGVTTAVIGNCGVGFAPCRPEQRDMLMRLMEGVEDIPEPVLAEGLPWNWESFPEFLDALAVRRWDLDIATQVPHAAIRVYAMGQRGADREPATAADRALMARLTAEGIRAGALGFSTSRTIAHKTLAGDPTPTLHAAEAELVEIGRAMREVGAGWMQVISDFDDVHEEFALLRRLAAASGRPMSISLLQRDWKPAEWRLILDSIAEANASGLRIMAQTMARPIGIMLGFEITQNPFMARASYRAIAHLPFARRIESLRDPEFRARLLSEPTDDPLQVFRVNTWDKIFPLTAPVDYEPAPEHSVAAQAARRGMDPAALCYDMLMEQDGRAILYRPITNYADGTLNAAHEMMRDPNTILGLSDGGAHVGTICDASAPTTTLTHWARDRTRGPRVELGWLVGRLTRDCAVAVGLADRGVIAPGAKADLNVIDFDRLRAHPPELRYDLPAGGKRLVQRTEGYVATIVSGVAVYRDGAATGALPGRLIRGAQSSHLMAVAAE
jgi:N-acyl-D-aspartate/D-glutamate deacylase